MGDINRSRVVRLSEVRAQLTEPSGGVPVLKRVTLDLKLNVLHPPNASAVHKQDEIYIVVGGRGVFVHGGQRDAFETGDYLFVAAGVEHHFEDFEEVTLWRIYYGPNGGELPV